MSKPTWAMGQKILYIEDNPANMRLVHRLLQVAGYNVLEAEDGLIGIAAATRERPDLILLDIHLPNISGLEVISRLRTNALTSEIPMVAVTAYGSPTDGPYFIAAGFDAFIPKPVSKRLLLDTVNVLLQTRPTIAERKPR